MKLHIGCGDKFLPGFLHYDVRKTGEHIDYIGRAEDLNIFSDGCIDEIYACHIAEHFDRNTIDEVLAEWNRVLKLGGYCALPFRILKRYQRNIIAITGFPT